MNKLISVSIVVTVLSGCATYTQTTSGKDYLARQGASVDQQTSLSPAKTNQSFADELRAAASVEPRLRFPARIGIVRLQPGASTSRYTLGGELASMSEREVVTWQELATRLGPSFGEFIPVQPLIVELMRGATDHDANAVRSSVDVVRLAAARQHLDAVLLYEIGTSIDENSNVLSLGNLTLIGGYILPSKRLGAKASASALLIDVLQGYPYGTANSVVDKADLTTSWGNDDARQRLQSDVEGVAAEKLASEVESMVKDLRYKLAEQREANRSP